MNRNIDPAAQCTALRTYHKLIAWAHGKGIKVDAAEAPMVVDDLSDGDMALQNGLQIAGSSPGYDRFYLMAYRSEVSAAGFDPGPAYVAAYYAAMQRYFGAAGQVSLGTPGHAPYDSLKPLEDDVRMLAGLGAKAIPIYSLEEMVAKFGASGIQTLANAAKQPMDQSEISKFAAPTRISEGILAASAAKNAMATGLTRTVTQQLGRPQKPNTWPGGCGIPR
jgi:hypothetical protein